jgi:hypothetical protein
VSQCNSCHRRIIWVRHHETGANMPLDLAPVDMHQHGAFVVFGQEAYPLAAATEKLALDRGISEPRARELLADFTWRTSHFATCRDADKFRRLK